MLRNQDALNDEQLPAGQISSHEDVGRQYKRLRTAEFTNVTDRTVQNTNPLYAALDAALTAGLEMACQPGGPIYRLFWTFEDRREGRRANRSCRANASELVSIPNRAGEFHQGFPVTVGQFWSINAAEANDLLEFYVIDVKPTISVDGRRRLLANYCGIELPTH